MALVVATVLYLILPYSLRLRTTVWDTYYVYFYFMLSNMSLLKKFMAQPRLTQESIQTFELFNTPFTTAFYVRENLLLANTGNNVN